MRGIALSASGMLIISPDGLLLRLVEEAGPWDMVFYRSLFSAIILGIVAFLRPRMGGVAAPLHLCRFTFASALLVGVANVCFVGAIVHTTVANTLVILAAMPLFGAVLGWMMIGEKVRPRTWVSIFVAMAGVVAIFADSMGGGDWLGNSLALATALFLALNLVVLRRAPHVDILVALSLSGFVGAIAVWPVSAPLAVSGHDMVLLAVLGLVVLPAGSALFFAGTRFAPAADVALVALLETVLGPIWVWLGVGEAPGVQVLVGGAVVLGAVTANALLAMGPGSVGPEESSRGS